MFAFPFAVHLHLHLCVHACLLWRSHLRVYLHLHLVMCVYVYQYVNSYNMETQATLMRLSMISYLRRFLTVGKGPQGFQILLVALSTIFDNMLKIHNGACSMHRYS